MNCRAVSSTFVYNWLYYGKSFRAISCTIELQLKVNCRNKFGLVCQLLVKSVQPKLYPKIHFRSTAIHFQLQFTCPCSDWWKVNCRDTTPQFTFRLQLVFGYNSLVFISTSTWSGPIYYLPIYLSIIILHLHWSYFSL